MLQWKIGDLRITQLVEMTYDGGWLDVLPDATPENLAKIPWLSPRFVTAGGNPIANYQMLILETPEQKIVVDTCIGNDKNLARDRWANMELPFLDNFKRLGYDPDSIDTVICTHLHVDHVGWNTRKQAGKWVPTFPNARYFFVKKEFEYWRDTDGSKFGDVFAESVEPVFDAGLAELVSPNHQIADGIRFESTPGHTPGHASVRLSSLGEQAIITGDLLHHPCQIARPEWGSPFDSDSSGALQTRRAFLERYADTPTLILGSHFANPVGGRIVRDGKTYRFDI